MKSKIVSVIKSKLSTTKLAAKLLLLSLLLGFFPQSVFAAPNPPSNLTATAVSSSQVNLSWADNSSDETKFKIERSTIPTGSFSLIGSTSTNVTTYSDTALPASTTYYYRVRAYNGSTYSDYSNVASATTQAAGQSAPPTPTGLAATPASSSQINLTWSDVSNETGYKVEQSLDSSSWTQVGATSANVVTYSATGLTASTRYYYRVRAYNASGDSGYSATATASTQAPSLLAPSNLVISLVATNELKLTWTDNSSNEFGFYVERATESTGAFTQIAQVGAGTTSYSDATLSEGVTRYYKVRAYGASGNSPYSNTTSGTTKLKAPTNLTASGSDPRSAAVFWADNSSGEESYLLERSETGTWTTLVELPANTTSYTDKTCQLGKTYSYRVTAKKGALVSDLSNVALVTMPPSVPINAQWIGHVPVNNPPVSYSYGVDASDNYLYSVSGDGLNIYSISSTRGQLPQFVANVPINALYSVDAAQIGGNEYAFVTDAMTLKVVRTSTHSVVASLNLPD